MNRDRGRFLGVLAQVLLVGIYLISETASPFDKTPLRWPQLTTRRGPIRSGTNIKDAVEGPIDLLLTDMPMTDAELQAVQKKRGVHLLHIATAVTAIVPCYNVSGLKEPLNFSPDTLARIYLGKITRWNDPALVALNPTALLPSSEILIVGHAEEDGSTYAWTDFLSKANADSRRSVGMVRAMFARPALLRGPTQEDIVDLIKRTPNSFSYAELWAAMNNGIQAGRVKNRSGRSIGASPSSMTAAAQTVVARIGNNFRASITDTEGADDYPVASFTWAVIPDKFDDAEARSVVISFLKFVITDGQAATESMHFGRLPHAFAERELQMLSSIE